MRSEKSCGIVVYRLIDSEVEFLAVKSKPDGHWGFPKGHMEEGETEEETARREVLEETGLRIHLNNGFRTEVEYRIHDKILKKVVFFIGQIADSSIILQKEELEDFKWLKFAEMLNLLTFRNIKSVLLQVKNFLERGENDQ